MITINGMETDARLFAYDGCHKIYLIETKDVSEHVRMIEEAEELGYRIELVDDLVEIYNNSCGLRFISDWKLTKQFVRQFHSDLYETTHNKYYTKGE